MFSRGDIGSNGGTERSNYQKLLGGPEHPFRPVLTTLGEHTVDPGRAPAARVNVFLTTKRSSIAISAGRCAHVGRPSTLVFPLGATVASAVHEGGYWGREAIGWSAQPRPVRGRI